MQTDQPIANKAELRLESRGDFQALLHVSGYWIREAAIPPLERTLVELSAQSLKQLSLQADVQAWDSRLPAYLFRIAEYCRQQNIALNDEGLPEGVLALLQLASAVPEAADASRSAFESNSFLANVGQAIINGWQGGRNLLGFVGELQLACWALLRGRARFRRIDLLLCIQEAGPNAFPIVSLISLLVGLILAFVGALQLAMFGAQIYIADLVALGTVREMGPLMTAIIMAGRTGAAYAAQLGTMNVNSEIDALKTMGISALEFLVLPRMLALVVMMPLLTLYADLMGISGGALVSYSAFDVSFIQYYNEITKRVDLDDFAVGVFKSVVFAVLIALAGCMRGMKCGRSAQAVGQAATAAVVDSIVYLVLADSVITLLCNSLQI